MKHPSALLLLAAKMVRRALLLAPLLGCAGEALVQGGAVSPIPTTGAEGASDAVRRGRLPALALEAAVGLGPGNNHGGLGLEVRTRSKFGGDVTNLSANVGLFAVGGSNEGRAWFFLGSAGVSVLGAVYAADQISFDVGTPYTQVGLGHRIGEGSALTGSIAGDWAVRGPGMPRTGYVGFLVGFGGVDYSVHSFH